MQNSRSVRPRHDLPRGVGLNSKPGIARPYFSQITANGVYAYLGSFETVEEARAAYLKAAEKLQGEHAFHLSRKPK
jgi:hypothetical protein